jgi:hypothetical protein
MKKKIIYTVIAVFTLLFVLFISLTIYQLFFDTGPVGKYKPVKVHIIK